MNQQFGHQPFFSGQQRSGVKDVTIDMETSAGIRGFFEGPYEPDYRVKKVVEGAENQYYKQKQQRSEFNDYLARQKYAEEVQQRLQSRTLVNNLEQARQETEMHTAQRLLD